MDRLLRRLFAPVDVALLVCVRVAFGGILLWHFFGFLSGGLIEPLYVAPRFHFTYPGFEWVRPWPAAGMYAHFAALCLCALFVALGLFYRLSAILLFLGFAYVFLLDRALYHNHYYLVLLISGILVFLPADREFSLDVLRRPALRSRVVPAWTVWLLRFQVGIVYFYSGLAKLDADWLVHFQPVRTSLAAKTDFPVIGPFFREDWMLALFIDGGLLLDLFIVPLLLWKRTRPFAFAVAAGFHLLNAALFEIGIFPWLMIALTAVFFRPDWPRRLFGGERSEVRRQRPENTEEEAGSAGGSHAQRRGVTVALLAVYVIAQLLIPLRQYLYPGNPSWTEQGHFFAWRLMARVKAARDVEFLVTDARGGRTWRIDAQQYVTERQIVRLSSDPDLILQFSHFLAAEFQRQGIAPVEVRALTAVSLNGRPLQRLVDPRVDLAAQPRSLRPKPWIVPLGAW